MEETNNQQYRIELFDRLRKSASLKKEEECFGCYMKSALWWLLEKPDPGPADLENAVHGTCPSLKNTAPEKKRRCMSVLMDAVKRARDTQKLVKFSCPEGLNGFIYPIVQGDRMYGHIGACYRQTNVSDHILDIFASYTDTLVKEIQKELELAKLYETLRPRAIALSTVHTVHRLISSTLDLNELLPRIARLSLQIMRANRCSIKLIDSKKKLLLPKATVDLRQKKARLKKVKVGRHAPGKAVKLGRPVRGDDYLAIPLIDEDVIGVITLYDKVDNKPFTAFDQEILSTLAEQAVIAIKNAQLYKEQERLTVGSIKSLAAVLDRRKPGTYVPRASFAKIAMSMGQAMHIDSDTLKSLEYASILHDAGEIVVPDEVLTKPTKLTGREYALIKGHPEAGVKIIRHMKALKTATPIILYHHENYDGSGYPKGLKREQIPLGARIMAVVSAFEAMITKRPYRASKKIGEAIEEVRRNSGTQFDPKAVEVFLKTIRRKDIRAMLEREIRIKSPGARRS